VEPPYDPTVYRPVMQTFFALHIHRKDGSSRRHIMRGEVPKAGDTVPATLEGERVSAKVERVADPMHRLIDGHDVVIEVHADEL
jgi:hypothetical protein